MSRYGFPESADWRALGDVCALWDEIGRARIQAWTHNLADYLRERLADAFGDEVLLQPTVDPQLKSAIVCFNPFSDAGQRCNPDFNVEFKERMLREYGFRISGGGVGPEGLTRAPDPEAAAFPAGLVPNRDPETLAPKPFGYALRANGCVWNSVSQMDRFVDAARDLVRKMRLQ
jgi:isopenicillin-N epimerase